MEGDGVGRTVGMGYLRMLSSQSRWNRANLFACLSMYKSSSAYYDADYLSKSRASCCAYSRVQSRSCRISRSDVEAPQNESPIDRMALLKRR